MKSIGRILIILLAASLVVGTAWALTRDGTNAQFTPGEARFRPEGGDSFAPGQLPEGFWEGGFDRGRRGGFLPISWIRNIGLIMVIVAVFVFIEYLIDRVRIKRITKIPDDDTQAA